ncbi:DUF4942 domain-containing protein [Escherichia coli]|uniref:DUF4942 domain-containing protein n=1 Tax=Escherichia coli TaxID=562 RepID=UPI0032D9018C
MAGWQQEPSSTPAQKAARILTTRTRVNRENITIRLDGHIQSVQGKERYEDEMFIIKYFKKGSAHITFKRLELIDRINDIIARYFPSVLSA